MEERAEMVFNGIRPVLHMPFAADASQAILDDELLALIESMIASDVDGLVVLGLASEAWALTDGERDHVVTMVAEAISGRIPLTVGLDGATGVAIDQARRWVARGASGLMVLPPRQAATQDALVSHFARLADAAKVPLLIQDSPQITGVTLDVDTIVALGLAHPLACSLKIEIPGAGAKVSAAHAAGVEIVAGWGGLGYLEQVERGAIGCMPGCDLGPAFVQIDAAARRGDHDAAQAAYRIILPLLAFETQSLDLLLLGAKRRLRRAGIFSTELLRDTARALDDSESRTLDRLLGELTDLGVPGFSAPGNGLVA